MLQLLTVLLDFIFHQNERFRVVAARPFDWGVRQGARCLLWCLVLHRDAFGLRLRWPTRLALVSCLPHRHRLAYFLDVDKVGLVSRCKGALMICTLHVNDEGLVLPRWLLCEARVIC